MLVHYLNVEYGKPKSRATAEDPSEVSMTSNSSDQADKSSPAAASGTEYDPVRFCQALNR